MSFGIHVSTFQINERFSHESLLHINQNIPSVVKMYVPICDRETRSIRTNEELSNLYQDTDIVTDTTIRGLEWLGHLLIRMAILLLYIL